MSASNAYLTHEQRQALISVRVDLEGSIRAEMQSEYSYHLGRLWSTVDALQSAFPDPFGDWLDDPLIELAEGC